MKGKLLLKSGKSFEGELDSQDHLPISGEVVFTTGMTGYPETLTDPSYKGQIIVFTYPLMGNFGVPTKETLESTQCHAKSVVVLEHSTLHSHPTALYSLKEWLKKQNVPLLTGVDTRALAKTIRSDGAPLGIVTHGPLIPFENPNEEHLVQQVSIKKPVLLGRGKKRIVAVDCGMKENIVRSLLSFGVEVLKVPYDFDYTNEDFDALFLSNGPGDPKKCHETIKILQKALKQERPIFGICLGAQVLALAAGAETYKLPFGHRGHNVPCMNVETGQCMITSQNHGYAIDAATLPEEWKVSWKNLNDGSVEGISHREKSQFAVQFHPEASPGPTEAKVLFEHFNLTTQTV